jgi:hypothetical protein
VEGFLKEKLFSFSLPKGAVAVFIDTSYMHLFVLSVGSQLTLFTLASYNSKNTKSCRFGKNYKIYGWKE